MNIIYRSYATSTEVTPLLLQLRHFYRSYAYRSYTTFTTIASLLPQAHHLYSSHATFIRIMPFLLQLRHFYRSCVSTLLQHLRHFCSSCVTSKTVTLLLVPGHFSVSNPFLPTVAFSQHLLSERLSLSA